VVGFLCGDWAVSARIVVVTCLVIWSPKNLLYGKEEHSNPALAPSALQDAMEDTIAAKVKPECLKNP
jgi:hypothetical protein